MGKKREASEDYVDEVAEAQKERRDADPQSQNCFGSACNQNNFGKKKREANAQSQNCFGSACSQNNFGKKKRDVIEAAEVLESEDVDEADEGQEKERRDADPQLQNCFGSACNQNNFGKKKRDADPQSQNCFGSACNQNNFGKKKREILEAINSLTEEMLEGEEDAAVGVAEDYVDEEREERERRDANAQSQNC